MSRNRRRHQNQVPIRALSPGLLLAFIVLAGGMSWVYLKNQDVSRGKEISALEKELKTLRIQNDALRSPIATLSSRTALQKRLNDGFISMVPITAERIVQVNFSRSSGALALAGDEIVPVSNQGATR